MLRVEASNLPSPRGAPRSRRLLPLPPGMKRPGASKARHEMLPPRAEDAGQGSEEQALPQLERSVRNERWSVRLELADAEIAKLYGQGMTRGAVVWKRGMEEWRPLLITPELSGLLRRTRTSLDEGPPLPSWSIEPSLPGPPRLPSSLAPVALVERAATPITVAPTAMDVEAPAKKSRRPIELAAVALAAFALAWIGHDRLATRGPTSASLSGAPTPVAAAACEPSASTSDTRSSLINASSANGGIPTVSVADLPLAGVLGSSASAHAGRSPARAGVSSANGEGPPRSALVGALGQVAQAAQGCGERGGPVRVVMSFANSGVARSIQVSGPDLPAATRSCIIGAASRARVPAFSGDPITVSKTL